MTNRGLASMDKTKPTRRYTEARLQLINNESAQTTIIQWPQICTAAEYHDFDAFFYALEKLGVACRGVEGLQFLEIDHLGSEHCAVFYLAGGEAEALAAVQELIDGKTTIRGVRGVRGVMQ